MTRRIWMVLPLAAIGALLVAGQPASGQGGKPAFTLKYGVLAGLTGDPAADGQAWNEAARLGIDQIAKALEAQPYRHQGRAVRFAGQPGQPAAGRRGRAEARQRRPCPGDHRRLLFVGDERRRAPR